MSMSKLDKRIQAMFDNGDDTLLDIELNKDVSEKLLSYQYLHVFNLISALRSNNCVLDGSDTGTGKTYSAIAVCRQLRLKPIIVCPKTMVSKWHQVCNYFRVLPLTITNYESLKNGKCYDREGNRVQCEYLIVSEINGVTHFTWKLPKFSILIFDEAHRCKNPKSINGMLLKSVRDLNNRTQCILISATIADTPKHFHIFGYLLGFYNRMSQGNNWVKGMLREDACYIGAQPRVSSINKHIYPNKGSRIKVSELGNKFPKNQVCAECYYLDKDSQEEVNRSFKTISAGLSQIKTVKDGTQKAEVLGDLIRVRQRLEMLKLPILKSLTEEYLENNYSVVLFVNFKKTLFALAKALSTTCLLYGDMGTNDRDKCIQRFQSNQDKLIICTLKAGGEGVSLDDQLGGCPRVSLISPCFSSIAMTQALGRIHRAGSKTPALQRIVYCAGTCEEVVCNTVNEKMKFMAALNDDDLINIKG